MSVVANPDRPDPAGGSGPHGSGPHGALPRAAWRNAVDRPAVDRPVVPARATTAGPSTRVLLLAALPAVLAGLLIRAWLMRTPSLELNADEGITGLQGFEVLTGTFRLIVAGNDYGSTTETYLFAPLLALWTGPWPLRLGAAALSVVAAYALFRLARPIYGRTVALTLALIGWTVSGAIVLLWSRAYMGYPTGIIAQVVTLALACHAMRTTQHLARTAFLAGLAAGFAVWSHPMFGVVALLSLAVPTFYRWRDLRDWWLPAGAGGLLGVSPWLVVILREGSPTPARPAFTTTYLERLGSFFTELLPRGFGVRTPDGTWLGATALTVTVAAVLIAGSLAGLVLLVVRRGPETWPILVAGFLAFPCLALFPPLAFYSDARYTLPFLPQLLMGLAAWTLLMPARARDSPWLVVVVPVAWAVAFCVPVQYHQDGWTMTNPDAAAEQVVIELHSRGVHFLAGEYWGTYLVDYLADGSLSVTTDSTVRFVEEAQRVAAADPRAVAYIYTGGLRPALALPADQYDLLTVGKWDLYLPRQGQPRALGLN